MTSSCPSFSAPVGVKKIGAATCAKFVCNDIKRPDSHFTKDITVGFLQIQETVSRSYPRIKNCFTAPVGSSSDLHDIFSNLVTTGSNGRGH